MTDRNQGGALRNFSPEQADQLFHRPALRHLFQENASDEYALIWLLSKHTTDTGSEKIYLKDIVRELNLPMPKVSAIRRWIDEKNPGCELEVDGGVDPVTCKTCIAAGANVLVAGSAVYKADDIPARIAELRG